MRPIWSMEAVRWPRPCIALFANNPAGRFANLLRCACVSLPYFGVTLSLLRLGVIVSRIQGERLLVAALEARQHDMVELAERLVAMAMRCFDEANDGADDGSDHATYELPPC